MSEENDRECNYLENKALNSLENFEKSTIRGA